MMKTDVRAIVAAIGLSIASIGFSGCERRGDVTKEGPDPMSKVDFNRADYVSEGLRQMDREEEAGKSLIMQYRERPMEVGPRLVDSLARAQDFVERGVYFAEETYLPGGLKVTNDLSPKEAVRVLTFLKENYDKVKADYLAGK